MTLPTAMKNHSLLTLLKGFAAALFLVSSTGTAMAAAQIALTPTSKAFPDTAINTDSATQTFTITNAGNAVLTVNSIGLSGTNQGDFVITPTTVPFDVAASGTATFTVKFHPSTYGNKAATLTVGSSAGPDTSSLSGKGLGPDASVTLVADGSAIVDGFAAGYDMPDVDLGTSANSTKVFRITNPGTSSLTISSITGQTAEFATPALATTIAAGGHVDFTVTFQPTSVGAGKTATLQINSDAPSPKDAYTIKLNADAKAPLISVDNFANNSTSSYTNTEIAFSRDVTYTVRNNGTSPLSLSSMTIGGTDSRYFSFVGNKPTTVGVGSSAAFTVRFGPSSVGAFSANIVIANNSVAAPSTNPYTINLSGQGVPNGALSDAFGYKCTTIGGGNILPFLVAGDPGVLTEASLSGIDRALPIDIGFDFFFYEKAYTRCSVSTTGLITFGTSSVKYIPDAIPDNSLPDEFIAPFWTDLQVTDTSKILYSTIGASPNRIFVVKYENVKLYNNGAAATDKRVTFQVQLYETSNSIQIRYQDEDPSIAFPDQMLTVGIESRNYPSGSTQPGVGIVGIQYRRGSANVEANRPFSSGTTAATSNKSIIFTRPVVISMESKYQRPDFPLDLACTTVANSKTVTCASTAGLAASMDISGANIPAGAEIASVTNATTFQLNVNASANGSSTLTVSGRVNVGSLAVGLNPSYGTIYQTPIGAVKRFEAPEFIYLNKDFEMLAAPGDVKDANSTDPLVAANVAWYRLVNDGYAIDGQVVQGTHAFFTVTLTRDVTVVWRWRLEYAAIVESGKPNGGAVNEGGRQWLKPGGQFVAVLDSPLDGLTEASGFRLKVTGYSLYDKNRTQIGMTVPVTAGSYVESNPLSMTGPVRLKWNWVGEVRYRFDAKSSGLTSNLQNSQSFIQVWTGFVPPTPGTPGSPGSPGTAGTPVYGIGPDFTYWIPIGSKISVGALYRTSDRRLTLGDFLAPPGGDITPIGRFVASLPDVTVNSKVARTYTTFATTPTDIHWLYEPTVFRAEIPIGQSFDPQNPDPQLVPDLATGGALKVVGTGPGSSIDTKIGSPEGSVLNGTPVRWDTVGKQLFPVQPGSHRVTWPDASGSGESYIVEIVTAFPGDTAALTTPREDEYGQRQDPPSYVMSTPALAQVTSDFPAAPVAHYRHLYDPVAGRKPPTKLDLSTTDEWAFKDLPFAEKGTAAVAASTEAGVPFSTSGTGRSVLLYSYRPNSDEIADGSLDKEKLAVRVVQSSPISVISRNDAKLVLGRKALELGSGATSGGAYGVVQAGGSTSSLDPGDKFVVDFWLNAKGLKTSLPVTLANCATLNGSTIVTCASTASVVPGMGISGTNIPAGTKIASITNATTLVISNPATAAANGLSLAATNKPVTVVSTGGGGLKVTLDPEGSTATATYRGVQVTHQLPKSGVAWRHYAIHVFTNTFYGVNVAIIDFYLDGVRQEKGFVTSWFPGAAGSTVSAGVTDNSLRFGVDAEPRSGLQLDNFRVFNLGADTLGYLNPGEVRRLRTEREMTAVGKQLRNVSPLVSFNFEGAPTSGWFANQGTLPNVGVGTVTGSGLYTGKWANTDLQEVATRLESTLDNASFGGSGYVINAVSNYNVNLYNRTREVGTWGPIFPVNHNQLFTDAARKLEVAYYENPYLSDRLTNPNVAWPYVATEYKDVVYPALGPDKDKAIYIASRIGSEGVDQKGYPQPVYDLTRYADLKIYNQPNSAVAGYNPNEEHALVAPAGRAALKVKNLGEDVPNNPPLAAFALQRDVNTSVPGYTSDPWVLVEVTNLTTGEPEMAAYQVFKTRDGVTAFPRPSTATVNAANSGLVYEAATNPEDAFLAIDATKAINFSYQFDYPVFAGDLLIPPYPLNLVIGNVPMADARGNSLQVSGVNQRSLWRDVNKNAWVVSGGGRFFHQFFYPFRGDFYLPGAQAGTPVAWLPDNGVNYVGTGSSLNPVKVIYNTFWRSDYPKLKRGETLTYQGGEHFAETPGAKGLPALVAMAASEVIYDSSTPSMVFGPAGTANSYDPGQASARIMRPLDRRENLFTVAQMGTAGFTPAASTKVLIVAERWYFKELPGSLQKRFYFDSLAGKLVFRGRLNEKESGDANLTSGPDPLNILEPNVLTKDDYTRIRALSADTAWTSAIDGLYLKVQNPNGVAGGNLDASLAAKNLQGLKNKPTDYPAELSTFWVKSGNTITQATSPTPAMVHLDSFGVGSALVPSPGLLTKNPDGSIYVTIAENNRTELVGAPVSLHIIEIIPDRYRGAIKVIEGSDAFSEKVTLQHNGEFGANTADLYYEWWIRDASPLDVVASEVLANGTLKQTDSNGQSLWQEYIPADRAALTDINAKHLGLHSIVFEGRPDVVLADKLVLMRYRHKDEANWKLVPFEFANASTAWKPGNIPVVSPAPFQWAGAANSPQLQADGSKRYIPQLVMGWVKRVLDRINPYEARYTDFFGNESPATYSSQIQIAGGPYAGKVALNPDKNVIENTGLIELYRTVLERAKELSIDNSSNGNATDGINQALLLAATRLSVLYELLGNEAYSDAQDSTINAGEDGSLAGVASFTHAFQNMEADLQHEELALLRGTDFGKSYPVYNRLFWNYAKGLGEAAYNVNYNIYDANSDGFINEDDARKLYPQGHGDAWGHYVSALDMHYTLLQHPGFSWKTRSELYSLMQNVLEVDFLDEKTFARLAAEKSRAGRDIVRETYRLNYTQNPDGQWQGYTDGADPARAWGVSEWAHRAGQAAHFDWAVANALLPEEAAAATPISSPENLDRIERSGSVDDVGEIAGGLHEIQVAMDEANSGVNPLGFDSDALSFDIDPASYDGGSTQFEQIYDRAVTAGGNAMTTLDFATQSQNKLRSLADDTEGLIQEAMSQDLDFRNRLIEIFGRPYDGTIGFGKAYPEGYLGPDTLLFAYLDKTKIDQIVPAKTAATGAASTVTYNKINDAVIGLMDNSTMTGLYNAAWGGGSTTHLKTAFESLVGNNNYLFEPLDPDGAGPLQPPSFTAPYTTASKYAFQALPDWGQRTSYGRLQGSLQDMLSDEIELDSAIADYIAYLRELENKLHRIDSQLALFDLKNKNHNKIRDARTALNAELITLNTIFSILSAASEAALYAANGIKDGLPTSIGFSNDVTSAGRGIASVVNSVATFLRDNAEILKELNEGIATAVEEAYEFKIELNNDQIDQLSELEGMVEEFQSMSGGEQPQRNAIGAALQNLEVHRQEYVTAQAEGFRLLREREAFNKILAAKVQKNRYQDMIFRLSRNEAMGKYQSSFNNAARYAWMAARAYDYETSLDPGSPAAPGALLDKIVKERQLGSWSDGQPSIGHGGLAEILAQLKGNFDVLKGQLGINNPQAETEKISLRGELFRIHSLDPDLEAASALKQSVTALNIPDSQLTFEQRQILATLDDPDNQAAVAQAPASDDRWKDALKARIVPDLNKVPEFVRHCRPFATGVQPGIVIRFSTCIEPGKNFFGQPLAEGDHQYSTANFATKIRGLGVWMDNYNAAGLSTSPRAYLVPIGNDYLRTSTSALPVTRTWDVVEQRIPAPFLINPGSISSPGYIPTLDGVGGPFGEVRRHGDFRMYHNNGDPEADDSELVMDSRLVSRSVWNSQWMLVIPGSGLGTDPDASLRKLADNIADIKLYFLTTSHQGQ